MQDGFDSLFYNNIGNKIKSLAKGIFAAEAAGSIVTVIFLYVDWEYWEWWYFLILIGGPLAGWISSLLLYGFGEIIDKLCVIAENTRNLTTSAGKQKKTDSERIERLKNLRAQGLITEEEYQQAISENP